MKVRTAAAQLLGQILRQRGSLSSLLPAAQDQVPERDRALLQELCFGSLRWQPKLEAYLELLLDKPLRAKDSDIKALLLLGLYQLIYTRIPDHAAIGDTVETARDLKKPWATRLANGVLRRFQRERQALEERLKDQPEFISAHPRWLLDSLERAWPKQIDSIIEANNSHPPLTLRLNTQKVSRDQYLIQLEDAGIEAEPTRHSPVGIQLRSPCDPRDLPLFAEGLISVQDESAQLAAQLLELKPGQRVLDACCAPGGKTGHILEAEPQLTQVVALDSDARRLKRVEENLNRLQLDAQIVCGDAGEPDAWWDGELYDRILLDAPCSATGIIRRHPDIKGLRSLDEIAKLTRLQTQLLDRLWTLVKPGGMLLYATCSVMPEENSRLIQAFVETHLDVRCEPIDAEWGLTQEFGRQLLPEKDRQDGFYYAQLHKLCC